MSCRFFAPGLLAVFLSVPSFAVDLEKGKEINGTCAACHGDLAQGGKKGEYPRLAGQHVLYLQKQLEKFRSRKRVNIPMFPYTQERELPDEDIREISAYLAGIKLSNQMPKYEGHEDALTRLLMAERVMIIPRVEGNIAIGGELYQDRCSACHGKTAKGRSANPMLVGQYTQYLKRQIDLFRKHDRPHDEEVPGGELDKLSEDEIQNILAYLTSIQEPSE